MSENLNEPLYLISVVAKMLEIHPQTLRQYEREGLIEPSRTDGKMRLYSKKDLERIKSIINLTRQMGVNLAGVDIILRLQDKITKYEELIKELQSTLNTSNPANKEQGIVPKKRSLIKKTSFDLVFVKE